MPRRTATITQADVARIVRAAKKAGAAEVEVRVGEATITVRMSSTATALVPSEPEELIRL